MSSQHKTGIGALVGLALLFGIILCGMAWQSWVAYSLGSEIPQKIRLEDLARNGPGDNIHVRVTDFVFGDGYVVQKKRGNWAAVWVPMFPVGQHPVAGEIKILVKSYNVRDEGQLHAFRHRDAVTGVITNPLFSPRSVELEELKKGYPGANLSSVLILEEGRAFPTQQSIFLKAGAGLVLLVASVVVIFVWLFSGRQKRPEGRTAMPERFGGK
jgi:hypothetical protein